MPSVCRIEHHATPRNARLCLMICGAGFRHGQMTSHSTIVTATLRANDDCSASREQPDIRESALAVVLRQRAMSRWLGGRSSICHVTPSGSTGASAINSQRGAPTDVPLPSVLTFSSRSSCPIFGGLHLACTARHRLVVVVGSLPIFWRRETVTADPSASLEPCPPGSRKPSLTTPSLDPAVPSHPHTHTVHHTLRVHSHRAHHQPAAQHPSHTAPYASSPSKRSTRWSLRAAPDTPEHRRHGVSMQL